MLNDLIKHSIFIQRYGSGLYNDLLPDLKELRDRILTKILSSTPYQMERLSLILKDIDTIIASGTKRFQPSLWGDFAEYENEFSLKMLDNNTQNVAIGAGLNAEAMAVVIGSSQMELDGKKKLTIAQAIDTFSKRYSKDIKSEIEFGIAEGETTDQIARRIQSLSNNRTRQQAKALVTTITNHVGNEVRSKVWEDYEDLFEGYEYVATLDGRTSPRCISLSGMIFKTLGTAIKPPQHFSCRSVLLPKIKKEYSLGIDTTRSSSSGQVPSSTTYDQWLRSQSKAIQVEVLGVKRREAWLSGKEPITRYIDSKGDYYTLEQLKQKDLIK